jgi:hypothetical protein
VSDIEIAGLFPAGNWSFIYLYIHSEEAKVPQITFTAVALQDYYSLTVRTGQYMKSAVNEQATATT